jgi:hypothetical protein
MMAGLILALIGAALLAWRTFSAGSQKDRADVHVEYTLHAAVAGDALLKALVDRLAALGRSLALRELGPTGEPAAPPGEGTRLVGTQVEIRLRGATGPGRLLLRLRREEDESVFGLIEIDDDGTSIYRRLAADVVRELGGILDGLGYVRLGADAEPLPATGLEAGEAL